MDDAKLRAVLEADYFGNLQWWSLCRMAGFTVRCTGRYAIGTVAGEPQQQQPLLILAAVDDVAARDLAAELPRVATRAMAVRPRVVEAIAAVRKVVQHQPCISWHFPGRVALPPTTTGLPASCTVRDLVESDAALVDRFWPHGGGKSEQYIARLIRERGGIAVVDDGSEHHPIAWSLRYESGAIGFLHVVPEHRRSGIAQEVMRIMIARCLADGNDGVVVPPFLYTVQSNTPAVRLMEKMGFVNDGLVVWISIKALQD
jgi:GNAT superfamily N-acetyltransferase